MQFGTRDEFTYFQCADCKCLQLLDIPENPSKYYPEKYYSFSPIVYHHSSAYERVKKYVRRKIIDHKSSGNSLLGRLLELRYSDRFVPYWLREQELKVSHDARILDIGCGNGQRLIDLEAIGFNRLLGIDPHIRSNIVYPNGIRILKSSVESMEGRFDFIMLHHSLEHMEDQLSVLEKVNSLLPADHYALVRIPICSYAWEHYGTNWAQIDAPRHVFLHSEKSISLVAAKAGFEVVAVINDSNEFQFWASEQYARDIPLVAENSYGINPTQSIFSEAEIESFKAKAEILNEEHRGDQACIYLRKV
jgi:SAM-dependent methyltransferase